mmetsp:Transcript_23569/g.23227  ORF Transcript_23569/g.23227 Transcript_23569/m.23227 type:complete len:105 (+) Transcript_23569:1799-2113(+)
MLAENEEEMMKLLEQERIIDQEIQEEIEQYRLRGQIGLDLDFNNIREGDSAEEDSPRVANQRPVGQSVESQSFVNARALNRQDPNSMVSASQASQNPPAPSFNQ